MQIRQHIFIALSAVLLINQFVSAAEEDVEEYAERFKKVRFQSCDETLKKIDDSGECHTSYCIDHLQAAYASCWNRSMNAELDKRLFKLKSTDPQQFSSEVKLQKEFNTATKKMCSKICDSTALPHYSAIEYSNCRVEAYKFRTAQARQINNHQLTIPLETGSSVENAAKDKSGGKEGKYYSSFLSQLCQMPKDVWKNEKIPENCEKVGMNEVDDFRRCD